MPAHPIPVYIPVSIDNFLVDEEFDMFDITPPYNKERAEVWKPRLVVDDTAWEESDGETQ